MRVTVQTYRRLNAETGREYELAGQMLQRPCNALFGAEGLQLAVDHRQCQRLPGFGQRVQRRQIEFSHVVSPAT